jgi:hypothetical protein
MKPLEKREYDFYRKIVNQKDFELSFIKSHLLIENYLDRLIKLGFLYGEHLLSNARLSFYQKVIIYESMIAKGDPWVKSIFEINKLRNKFAHDLSYKATLKDADAIGGTWSKEYKTRRKKQWRKPKLLISIATGLVCATLAGEVLDAIDDFKAGKLGIALVPIDIYTSTPNQPAHPTRGAVRSRTTHRHPQPRPRPPRVADR